MKKDLWSFRRSFLCKGIISLKKFESGGQKDGK